MHLLLAVLVLAAGTSTVLPKSATVVDAKQDAVGETVGNVLVTFTDGHKEKWTKLGKSMLPKVSVKGLVGWAQYDVLGYRDYPVFNIIRIVWPDQHQCDFQSTDSFIEAWDFADGGSSVIIKSREGHGAPDFLKYDIASGKELAHVDGWENQILPDWAKPYADSN